MFKPGDLVQYYQVSKNGYGYVNKYPAEVLKRGKVRVQILLGTFDHQGMVSRWVDPANLMR